MVFMNVINTWGANMAGFLNFVTLTDTNNAEVIKIIKNLNPHPNQTKGGSTLGVSPDNPESFQYHAGGVS